MAASCSAPKKAADAAIAEAPKTGLQGKARVEFDALFWQAEKYRLTENYDSALVVYRRLEEMDPANPNIHFQEGQIYLLKTELSMALDKARRAVALDQKNPWYLDLECNILMRQGNLKESVEAFDRKIRLFPQDGDAYLNQAFLYLQMNNLNKAIEVYNAYEKRFGVDESVSLQKQKIFLKQNKFEEALGELKKLEEAFPGEVEYLRMQASLYSANNMNEKAVEIYRKILEMEPDNPEALLALADADAKGDPEARAAKLLNLFANPKVGIDTKIQVLMPYLQFFELQKEKAPEAEELSKVLVQTHPAEAKAWAVRGDLFYLQEKNDSALDAYLRALELTKEVFTVWQQVILIYNSRQDFEAVYKTSSEAIEYFPNQAFLYLFRGTAENQQKRFEQAVKSYRKGIKLSGANVKLEAQFWGNLGDSYHSLGDFAASDSAYDVSLKLDPENAYVLNNYSYYLSLRKQKLEKAREMAAYANKLSPGNESFLDTYAWVLFCLGRYKEAREWQDKALKATGKPNGTLLEHYGDILFRLGEEKQAMEYWKKAAEMGGGSDLLPRKIESQKYLE